MIYFSRSTETLVDKKGKTGRRCTLRAGELVLHAIERADGYKWLRPGIYACKMDYWVSKRGVKSEAIRVMGEYSKGKHGYPRICIHPANWPYQLEGCIALGLTQMFDGVGNSRSGFLDLWDELGGWEEGKELRLEVQGLPELEVQN